jgi:asparagine synthetase A
MKILAVIGNESHTTSSGWSKIKINGRSVSFRDASSKVWLSEYKDKHASWCECIFDVKSGDKIEWEAGSNSGYRGANHNRVHQIFVADESAESINLSPLGYPADNAKLSGKLRLVEDKIEGIAAAHAMAVASV